LVRVENWIDLIGRAFWPVAVIVLVLLLRKPISDALTSLAGRVTKVSVMSVSLELSVARPAELPWQGIGGVDARGLVVASDVNDSYFGSLRTALMGSGSADYFVVDL
jgi:hypothetical protein